MIIFTTSPQRIGRDRPISIPQRKIDLPPNSTPGWNTLDLKFFQQQCSTFKKIRNSRQQGGEAWTRWIPMNQSSTDDRLNWTKRPRSARRKPYRLKRARDQEDLLYSMPPTWLPAKPPFEGVARAEPQSRVRHVPGITNYAPRTVIISWAQWARCIDTVNIWHGKHRHHSPFRFMNKVLCPNAALDIWFSHMGIASFLPSFLSFLPSFLRGEGKERAWITRGVVNVCSFSFCWEGILEHRFFFFFFRRGILSKDRHACFQDFSSWIFSLNSTFYSI